MKSNTKRSVKSSITLPPREFKLVRELKRDLKAKSNVEVIRMSLELMKRLRDREELKTRFREASEAARKHLHAELVELDHLSGELIE